MATKPYDPAGGALVMTKTVLTCAEALIRSPGRWTRGAYARRADGRAVDVLHPDAVCWCAVGAVLRVAEDEASAALPFYRDEWRKTAWRAIRELTRAAGADVSAEDDDAIASEDTIAAVLSINDARGKHAVLALFRAALSPVYGG
jgi:hypothetical protein